MSNDAAPNLHELPTLRTGKGAGPIEPMADPGDPASTLAYQPAQTTSTSAGLPRRFGEYLLIEELGRGGMGVVFRARQETLDRVVALKMVRPGTLASDEELQRFRAEAAAAARLRHPHIVSVHEVGQIDGQHYFTMDFIDGPSLARRLAREPLTEQEAADYVRLVARAVDHAHQNGILHRDLKPSNILLDEAGQPHVADFGLAKQIGDSSGQTQTGAVVGTPSYMAPEQANGRNKDLGPPTDIYGLGAVLYELLTGRQVFRAGSALETIAMVIEREPVPPRDLNPKIDRDLETICLKCLQKEPSERYPSAAALADDLDRYRIGESISARSFTVMDRLARTLDRSHHAVEFRTWERMLWWFAALMFLGHLTMYVLIQTHQPRWMHLATRIAQFGLMGVVFLAVSRPQIASFIAGGAAIVVDMDGLFHCLFHHLGGACTNLGNLAPGTKANSIRFRRY